MCGGKLDIDQTEMGNHRLPRSGLVLPSLIIGSEIDLHSRNCVANYQRDPLFAWSPLRIPV